ncbi:hypothetical protein N8E89_09350 [Phyllobacterium sp. A18/5-2]|uniref:hypothetical protein n=1 Tax=Phyllobacterium sp. A18/5-2 TaxID=2978392 RepID=UPI0021C7116C|nr:hypothetical protein [Phyllobacterium sp. A18/5-2]UXN62921.1 hypothetical protein N8E89_09350 [Phyllobacterium sp. A18/5-2]
MAIKPDYQAGNASVAVGGTTVTFAGGANITAATITAGDTFKVQNLDAVIASVTDSTHLELAEPWSGTALVAGPYRIRFQPDGSRYSAAVKDLVDTLGNGNVLALAGLTGALDEIPIFTGAGSMATISKINLTQGIDVDVKVETLAERAGYDGQAAGYSVLVANVGDGRSAVYFKVSNTSGDWSDPAYLTGPNGSFQSKGIYSGATAYQLGDVVLQNGSSWIARVNTTGNAPPALPTTSNTQWFLLSAAGNTFTIKGAYNPATAYLKDDVVTDAGSSWIAIQSTTGNAPPVQPSQSNAYWNLLSAKGTDGAVQGVLTPQGRLSLVSGVAVPTSDVVAATTLYYVPCIGTRVPVWDGTQMVLRDIGSGLSVALSATYQVAFNQIDWFVFMDGATLRLGHGPNWSAGAVAGSQFARGTGAGSTELELKNGIYTNKNSITLRFGTVAGNTVTVPARSSHISWFDR